MVHALMPVAEPYSHPGEGEQARVGVAVVHGLTGNPASTRPLGQALAKEGYAVEVPLLPGHGTHWRDLARVRYADFRAALNRVVDDLVARCDRVVLVGLSLGGTLVLDVGSRRHAEIAGVAVINVPILDRKGLLPRINPLMQYVVPAAPRDLADMPTGDIAKPGADEHAYPMVPTKMGWSCQRELPGIRTRLADLDVPVLVLYAPQDHTVPAENSLALPQYLGTSDVTLVELDRSYHVATLDWDADVVEQSVLDFVRRVAT